MTTRLLVVRIRWIPAEREREAAGRDDLQELTVEVEERAVGRLHGDATGAADPRVELDARSGEAPWSPPCRQLDGIDQRPIDVGPRSAEPSRESHDACRGRPHGQWRLGSRPAASRPRNVYARFAPSGCMKGVARMSRYARASGLPFR